MSLEKSSWSVRFIFFRTTKKIICKIRPVMVLKEKTSAIYETRFMYSIKSGFIFSCLPKEYHTFYTRFRDGLLNLPKNVAPSRASYICVMDELTKNEFLKRVEDSRVKVYKKILD